MEEKSNLEPTEQLEQLVPKKNAASVVWTDCGFSEHDTEEV